ncbi:hypothetical protein [Aliivibrio fischeri]|uniref:hypothetical protein n=1 Tax=Aliivibrio fischeri TaxID=668 RepID=UPI001F37EB9A|nr:hypothetical protein [Aliivibrio fischeri]MCE4934260.1 hypothetical protein [Aliivibrio fischeri]
MSRNYLYSVTDKALSDALNQSQISNNELRDLFLTRGVLISKKTDRKELAKNFSKYIHDYYDHQKIANSLGTIPRKEKISSSFVTSKVSFDILENAAEALKSKIINEQDLCHIVHTADDTLVIDITYETTCYAKSDFKQIVQKNAVIEIEKHEDNYVIRKPANDNVKEYEEHFLNFVNKELVELKENDELDGCDEELFVEEISLLNVVDKSLRTKFFTRLVSSFNGYVLDDVTDVFVYKPKIEDQFSDEDEDEDDKEESSVVCHITKVSLKGEGVLISDELDALSKKDFYICKIRWRIKEDLPDPDIFEFEAQFSNAADFTGFSFIPKGAIRYKGKGEHQKSKKSLTEDEERKFNKIIEQSARNIMSDILKEAQGDNGNDSSKDKVVQVKDEILTK